MGKVRESQSEACSVRVAYGCVSMYISLAERHNDKNKQMDRSRWEVAEPKRDLFCIQTIITTSLVAFWNFPLHTPLGLLGRSSPELDQIPHSLIHN